MKRVERMKACENAIDEVFQNNQYILWKEFLYSYSAKSGISVRTIEEYLKVFESSGKIYIDRRSSGAMIYRSKEACEESVKTIIDSLKRQFDNW